MPLAGCEHTRTRRRTSGVAVKARLRCPWDRDREPTGTGLPVGPSRGEVETLRNQLPPLRKSRYPLRVDGIRVGRARLASKLPSSEPTRSCRGRSRLHRTPGRGNGVRREETRASDGRFPRRPACETGVGRSPRRRHFMEGEVPRHEQNDVVAIPASTSLEPDSLGQRGHTSKGTPRGGATVQSLSSGEEPDLGAVGLPEGKNGSLCPRDFRRFLGRDGT